MLENKFKTLLIEDIKNLFPGCLVFHLDPQDYQGVPDLLILYKDMWAALEGKKSINSPYRPNQEYYINKMNQMSFASFIYPENKREVLDALEYTFNS